MSAPTKLVLGVAGGYLLGRRKKMKLAITLGSMLAGQRIATNPRGLMQQGMKLVESNPELSKLSDQVRSQLFDAARAAAIATANSRMDGISDAIRQRSDRLALMGGDDQAEDEYDEDEYDEEETTRSRRRPRRSPRRSLRRSLRTSADEEPEEEERAAPAPQATTYVTQWLGGEPAPAVVAAPARKSTPRKRPSPASAAKKSAPGTAKKETSTAQEEHLVRDDQEGRVDQEVDLRPARKASSGAAKKSSTTAKKTSTSAQKRASSAGSTRKAPAKKAATAKKATPAKKSASLDGQEGRAREEDSRAKVHGEEDPRQEDLVEQYA